MRDGSGEGVVSRSDLLLLGALCVGKVGGGGMGMVM